MVRILVRLRSGRYSSDRPVFFLTNTHHNNTKNYQLGFQSIDSFRQLEVVQKRCRFQISPSSSSFLHFAAITLILKPVNQKNIFEHQHEPIKFTPPLGQQSWLLGLYVRGFVGSVAQHVRSILL